MSESEMTSAVQNESEMDESVPGIEFSDNPVCVGDGKVCAECGKVFSHPFYFSTHISIHYSEKRFSIGQCNLCGLTFSDPHIYQKHLNSSTTRMSEQPPDEHDIKNETDLSSEYHAQDDQNFDENGETMNLDEVVVKQEVDPDMTDDLLTVNQELVRNQNSNFEPNAKRRRKMTQRYEPELISGPSMVNPDTDPAVEAYLMSLSEMGLTVDPAAFANPRARGRGRKFMGPSRGRWRGQKFPTGRDFMMADAFPPAPAPKKPSPKYEYLDYDILLEDDVEVLPKSGKQTRGQRLQQRQERLSQQKDSVKGQDAPNGSEPAVKEEPAQDEKIESDSTTTESAAVSTTASAAISTTVSAAPSATAAENPAVNKTLKRSLPSTSAGPSLVDRSFALDKQMIKAELTDKDYSPRASSHSKARGRGSSQKRGASPAVQAAQVRSSAPGAPRPGFTGYAMASPTFRPAVSLGSDVVRPPVNKVSRAGMASTPVRMKTVTATSSASSVPKVHKMSKPLSGIEKYKQESREYVEIMLQSLTDELIPTKMGKNSVTSKTYFGKSGDLSLGSSSSYSGNQSFFPGAGGTGGLMTSQRQNFGRGGLSTDTYMYGSQFGQWSQPAGLWPMNSSGGRGQGSFGLFNPRPPRARGNRGAGSRGGATQSQRGATGQRGRGGRGHSMMGVMPSTLMGPVAGVTPKLPQGFPAQPKPPLNPPTVYPVKMGRGGVGVARGGVSTARGGLAPQAKITPPPPVSVPKPAISTAEVIVLDDDEEDNSVAKGQESPRKKQSSCDSSEAGPSGVTPVKKTAVIVDIDKEGGKIAVIENSDKKQDASLQDSDKGSDKKLQLSPSVRLTRIDDVKASPSKDKTELPKYDHTDTGSRASPSGSEDNSMVNKGEAMLEVEDIDGWKVCLAKDSESESNGESDQDSRGSATAAGKRKKVKSSKSSEESSLAERPASVPSADTQMGGLENQPDPLKRSLDDSPDLVDKHKSESSPRSGNSVLASHDTEDSLSSSVPSASSVPLTFPNFIGDTDNLLDIFSEIEKTCKEIEENSGNERDDSGAESDTKDLKGSESCSKVASAQTQRDNSSDREGEQEGKIGEALKNVDGPEQRKKRHSNARGSGNKHSGQRKDKGDQKGTKEKDDLNSPKIIEGRKVAHGDDDDEEPSGNDERGDDERSSDNESREEDNMSDADDEDENKVERQAAVADQSEDHEHSREHDESSEQGTGRGYGDSKPAVVSTEHDDLGATTTLDLKATTQIDYPEHEANTWETDTEKIGMDCEEASQKLCKKSDKDPENVSEERNHKTYAGLTGLSKENEDSVVVPCESESGYGGRGTFDKDQCPTELAATDSEAKSCSNEDIEMDKEHRKGGGMSTKWVHEVNEKGDYSPVMAVRGGEGRKKVEKSNGETLNTCPNSQSKRDLAGGELEEAGDTRSTHEERFGEAKPLEHEEGNDVSDSKEAQSDLSGGERKVQPCSNDTSDCVESDSQGEKKDNGSDEVTSTGLETALVEPNIFCQQGVQDDSDHGTKKKSTGRSSCKDETLEDNSDHDSDRDKDGSKRNSGGRQGGGPSPHCQPHNPSETNCSNSSNSGDTSGGNGHCLSLSLTNISNCATIIEGQSNFSGIHPAGFGSDLSPHCGCAMCVGEKIHPVSHHCENGNLMTTHSPSKFPICASGSSEKCNNFHHRRRRSSSSSKALDQCSFWKDIGTTLLPPLKFCSKRNIQAFNDKCMPDRSDKIPSACEIASRHCILSEMLSCLQEYSSNIPTNDTAPQEANHHFSKMPSVNQGQQRNPTACCWCSSEPNIFIKQYVRHGCRKGLASPRLCCKHSRRAKYNFRTRLHSSLMSRLAKLLGSKLAESSKWEVRTQPACNNISIPAINGDITECEMAGLTKSWPGHCKNDLLVEFQALELLENNLDAGQSKNGSAQPKWLRSTRMKSWAKSLHKASTKTLSRNVFPFISQSQTRDKTKVVNQCLLNLTTKDRDYGKLLLQPVLTDSLDYNSKLTFGCVHFKAGCKEASTKEQLLVTDSNCWPVRTCGQKNGKNNGRPASGQANSTHEEKSGGCSKKNKRNYNSEDDDTGSDSDENDNTDGDDNESPDDGVYQLVDCPICGIIFKHIKFVKRHISLKHKKWSLNNKPIGSARPLSYVQVKRPCAERVPTFMKLTESQQVSGNLYETMVLERGTVKKEVVVVKPVKPVVRMDSGIEKKSKLDKGKSHKLPRANTGGKVKASTQHLWTVGQKEHLAERNGVEPEEKLDCHKEQRLSIGDKPEQGPAIAGNVYIDPLRNNGEESHCDQERHGKNWDKKVDAMGKSTDDLIQPPLGNDATSALMQVKLEACEGQPDSECPRAFPENELQVKAEPVSDSEEEFLTVTFDETEVSKKLKTNLLVEETGPAASDSSKVSRGTQQSGQSNSSDSDCPNDLLTATPTAALEESKQHPTASKHSKETETNIKLHSVVSLAAGKTVIKDKGVSPPPHVIRNVGQSVPEKQEVIFVYPKKPVVNFSSRCRTLASTTQGIGQNAGALAKHSSESRTKEKFSSKPTSQLLSRKRKHDLESQADGVKKVISTSTELDVKKSAPAAKEEQSQSATSLSLRGTMTQPASDHGSSTVAEPSKKSASLGQDASAASCFPSQEWCVTGPTVIYVHPQKPIINFSGRAPRPSPARSRNSSKLKNDA